MRKIFLAVMLTLVSSVAVAQTAGPIVTESTSTVYSTSTTTVNSLPPTAASPSIN